MDLSTVWHVRGLMKLVKILPSVKLVLVFKYTHFLGLGGLLPLIPELKGEDWHTLIQF